MKGSTEQILKQLSRTYPVLTQTENSLLEATELLCTAFRHGKQLLVCGNGGSAADALHIVGELMKSFVLPRRLQADLSKRIMSECEHGDYLLSHLQGTLPAISLVNEVSLITAYANDAAADLGFAQQVLGYGHSGDALLAISTSGNSNNVIYACEVARALDMSVIGLTGMTGGKMKGLCNVLISAPETVTCRIQELHLPLYHAICLALENEFFGGEQTT